jgi:hypothetical protein
LRTFTQAASLVVEDFRGRLLLIPETAIYSLRAAQPTGYYPFSRRWTAQM